MNNLPDHGADYLIGRLRIVLEDAVKRHPADAPLADALDAIRAYEAGEAEALAAVDAQPTISEQECSYLWLIWSDHHKAWWGPNSSGYRNHVADAGRYTQAEAAKELHRGCYCCLTPELAIPNPSSSLTGRDLDRWIEEAINNARATRIEHHDINRCYNPIEAAGGTR